MQQPLITVFGATGAQGGGLARAILADPERRFALRAVTRKPHGDAARQLADAGADVVVADLDDAGSVRRALAGSYGAFCVTNFWEHFSPEKETEQARAMAAAAARAGVRHAIWSTLEDTRTFFAPDGRRMPVLLGRYNVPHFDAKGEADGLFAEYGVPTTRLYTSCYWENFIHFGLGPHRGADGRLVLRLPTAQRRIPWIAVEDIGRSAFRIFADGEKWIGHAVGVAGEHLSGEEVARQLGAALGEPVHFDAVTPDAYRAGGFPGADELGNMFQFKHDYAEAYCALRDVARSRALHPGMQTFADWLASNAARIPLN